MDFAWSASGNQNNGNGRTFASWNWKANGQGSANTDGSINIIHFSECYIRIFYCCMEWKWN